MIVPPVVCVRQDLACPSLPRRVTYYTAGWGMPVRRVSYLAIVRTFLPVAVLRLLFESRQ